VRRFLSLNSLSVFFLLIFLASVAAQALTGHSDYNQQQLDHGESTVTLGRYLTSSEFGQAVMENWQSEYLQFALYIFGTIWLIQRGSPESKEPEDVGRMSEEDQLLGPHAKDDSPSWAKADDLRRVIFSNSLLLLMGSLFIGTFFASSVCGWSVFNQEELTHKAADVSYWQYIGSADFWESSLQNWQSEFLAIGSMAIFSVFLRQRGSPESKQVGAPHGETGEKV
jgi:hypothetical protein